MRHLISASLICLVAWTGIGHANPAAKERPFITDAEGSACMGDDKSRKQTEEIARNEARRRAAEQAATQVRSQSRVSIGTLEEDVIKIIATGKVRVIDVLDSKWDKDGCYSYRIRAEVTPVRPSEMAGGALSEEDRLWAAIEDAPDLIDVDGFLTHYPLNPNHAKVRALQSELEAGYPRIAGTYLVYRDSTLSLRPAAKAIAISEVAPGELVVVFKAHDTHWAIIKRDVGQVYTPFANLRPITDEEAAAWQRCIKNCKDVRAWQGFLQTYPRSHLTRLAKDRLTHMGNRLSHEEGMSSRDSEEIALWNRCLKTRDLQCAREYRRRYPNGKFEKESWLIH